jgi:hypothetical protein
MDCRVKPGNDECGMPRAINLTAIETNQKEVEA